VTLVPDDRSNDPDPETSSSVIGVDLGGTKLAAGWVARTGRRVGPRRYRTHANPPAAAMVDEIVQIVEELRSERPRSLRALGVGVAAQVRERDGSVSYAPNLGWTGVPLGRELEARLGTPVEVLNDARAATLAVWRHGPGRGEDELLVVIVGTGVGGSLVSGGHLLGGASDAFGEVGHSILVSGGRKCHCPGRGCLEAYVGGWAIAERARESADAFPERAAGLRAAAGRTGALDARAVRAAADDGDPLAREIVSETAGSLGQGVAGLVNALNPRQVLLGGGIIDAFPEFLPAVVEAIRAHCQPPAALAARVGTVALDPDSVLVGAATRAYDNGLPLRPTGGAGAGRG
jgi:glucokinase